MVEIIVGTDRLDSKSEAMALVLQKLYSEIGMASQVMRLRQVMPGFKEGCQYGDVKSEELKSAIDRVARAKGLVLVVPEYNGSYPGALKYFIDHWKYPDSFEFRPVAFVGIGGRFGGLRPVEHLQQVFGYRNAFIYPERVFVMNVWDHFKKTESNPEGTFSDPTHLALLMKQTKGFSRFITALEREQLHCLTRQG